MHLSRKAQFFFVIILSALCTVSYFIFEGIKPFYFSEDCEGLHIIDIHVMLCKLNGLFDGGYIHRVSQCYDAALYKQSFFLVDLQFLLLYTAVFLLLSFRYRHKQWYPWILVSYIAGALCDLTEKGFFLYYLYHPSGWSATMTAVFTTLKSFLFPFNIVLSLVLYIKGPGIKKS